MVEGDVKVAAVIEALRRCYDPEIPISVYDLGLIYELNVDDYRAVHIRMTLTSRGCPLAQDIPAKVKQAVSDVAGVSEVIVTVVFDPPWDSSRISPTGRAELGLSDR